MNSPTVLISGSSIAGLTLAFWLRRYGFTPTVIERAPAPRDGGHAIDLRGVAREVVERMGLLDTVRQASIGTHGMAYVNQTNKRLANMGADLLGESGGAVADIEILRGDLVKILYAATRNEIEFCFDNTITALTQGPEGVGVTFERGDPRTFALVVGADGVHSHVRDLEFGDEGQWVRHLGAYVAIFTTPAPLEMDGWELLYNIPGKTAGVYPTRTSAEAKAIFFFASPPLRYDRQNVAQQQQILAEAFAGLGWKVPTLLAAMPQASDFYFDAVSQVHLDQWSRGRVALVGDAAYCASPMAGIGTSLALVGAYVLAGELAAADGDHSKAFASYEQTMRAYVTAGQQMAKSNAIGLIPRSRFQIAMRNQGIRMLQHLPRRVRESIGAEQTANAITLKDYRG